MAQVVSHQAELQAAQTGVVTISFGTPYWSQTWLQETKSPFPFLLDPQRVAYQAYGLQTSILRSWSPANVWYYAKARQQGRPTLGKRGDPHQLGGDFLIDAQGIIRFAHGSRQPTDRPPIATIMGFLP